MKVYITYDRYERDEWFRVYQITDKLREVKRDYKENLIDFISVGPDDCHSYQIQVLEMTKEEYEKLKKLVEEEGFKDFPSKEFMDTMTDIYDKCVWCQYPNTNCLLCTDGCTDNVDVINFWIQLNNLDEDDFDDIQEQVFDDETLYHKVLKMHIDQTYKI